MHIFIRPKGSIAWGELWKYSTAQKTEFGTAPPHTQPLHAPLIHIAGSVLAVWHYHNLICNTVTVFQYRVLPSVHSVIWHCWFGDQLVAVRKCSHWAKPTHPQTTPEKKATQNGMWCVCVCAVDWANPRFSAIATTPFAKRVWSMSSI